MALSTPESPACTAASRMRSVRKSPKESACQNTSFEMK